MNVEEIKAKKAEESAAVAAETQKGESDAEKLANLKALEENLLRQTATTVAGANDLAPKAANFLITDAVKAKNAGFRLRWVQLQDKQKAVLRLHDGWERVPVSDGGSQIGDEYALFRLPIAKYDARQKELAEENRRRLKNTGRELEATTEAVLRELEARGITPKKGILIKEM